MSPHRQQAAVLRGRYAYLLAQPWELGIALAGIWSGAGFFLLPRILADASIGRTLGNGLDVVWSLTYLSAGVLMLVGLALPRIRIELPGVILIAGALLTQGIAIVSVFGIRGMLSVPQLFFLAVAAAIRVYAIVAANDALRRVP